MWLSELLEVADERGVDHHSAADGVQRLDDFGWVAPEMTRAARPLVLRTREALKRGLRSARGPNGKRRCTGRPGRGRR